MQLKLIISLVISVLCVFTLNAEAGGRQHKSNKSNICLNSKLQLTKGIQILKGSCSTTIQGEIPASDKMPSTIIVSPENGETIKPHKEFDIKVLVKNVLTGHFSDPANGTYYTKPQQLTDDGLIKGHLHVTIQEIINKQVPLDSSKFAFFEGVNDVGTKKGKGITELRTKVDKGLNPGEYRLCTISGTETHQPWLMPVAKRGAQDDCIRFNVKNV